MTQEMLLAIAPQLLLSLGIAISLLFVAWQRSQLMIQRLTQLIIFTAIVINCQSFYQPTIAVTDLVLVDSISRFAFFLLASVVLVVSQLSREFLQQHSEVHDEYYLLLQLLLLGASILIISDHFATLFLGFELLSIALVGLVGYIRNKKHVVETGFKYLILSATASSFMLLGIAFIYSQTGQLNFTESLSLLTIDDAMSDFYLLGVVLFMVGLVFKLSLVPFHFWTPDVYQGAPSLVTMLMATVSKVAMFVILLKVWLTLAVFQSDNLITLVSCFAIASMLVGNLLALQQTHIKRLLAYSSIAHMGYLLIVLVINSQTNISLAWQSSLFYLAAYLLATVSIFIVICATEHVHGDIEVELETWRGLFWQHRGLAVLLLLALLSLAGIPLSMGFIGKFYLLAYATTSQLWGIIFSLIIGSGIGLFYYLRVIFMIFNDPKPESNSVPLLNNKLSLSVQAFVLILSSLALFLGLHFGILRPA